MFYPKSTFVLYRNCSFGGIKFTRGVHHGGLRSCVGFAYTYLILEDCLEVKMCCAVSLIAQAATPISILWSLDFWCSREYLEIADPDGSLRLSHIFMSWIIIPFPVPISLIHSFGVLDVIHQHKVALQLPFTFFFFLGGRGECNVIACYFRSSSSS